MDSRPATWAKVDHFHKLWRHWALMPWCNNATLGRKKTINDLSSLWPSFQSCGSCPESPLCLGHDIHPGGSFHCIAAICTPVQCIVMHSTPVNYIAVQQAFSGRILSYGIFGVYAIAIAISPTDTKFFLIRLNRHSHFRDTVICHCPS